MSSCARCRKFRLLAAVGRPIAAASVTRQLRVLADKRWGGGGGLIRVLKLRRVAPGLRRKWGVLRGNAAKPNAPSSSPETFPPPPCPSPGRKSPSRLVYPGQVTPSGLSAPGADRARRSGWTSVCHRNRIGIDPGALGPAPPFRSGSYQLTDREGTSCNANSSANRFERVLLQETQTNKQVSR